VAAAKKKKSLVIVESPAKAKTINKYLGPDFEVAASKGHVRDLPKSRFGIDVEAGWVPTYRPLRDRKEVLDSLKKQAAKAGMVYLAPDPDREGEAIAWHLKEALGLSDERTRRVSFNEITKTAVEKAFTMAGSIDMDRVQAQEARRFLDRVVGYKLSPLICRKLAQTDLSAGRVQSVAVRLIVEREREIEKFNPEEFWRVTALLTPSEDLAGSYKGFKGNNDKLQYQEYKSRSEKAKEKDKETREEIPEEAFFAELAEWAGQKFTAGNLEQAKSIAEALENAAYTVSRVEQKDREEKAPPPFTTSTLQQQAAGRLHFAAKRTMMIAQQLYQGVELGSEGSVALITYMRTDSTRVSDDALKSVRDHIKDTFGEPYLPDKANRFPSGKSAQEAHEAIRPTDLSYTPERVARFLSGEHHKLYTLIYNRFVASQMKPAVWAVTNVEITAAEGLFKAQGKILKFEGYRKVLAPAAKLDDTLLPPLSEKQLLHLLRLTASQHFTEPPPRYNEASLVKTLEKEGIGRPSTYATIISKIQEREYVVQKERRFYATDLGMTVNDLLVEHFSHIMDLQFTSHMEEELDQIETKKFQRNDVLNEFYDRFMQDFKVAETKIESEAEKCPLCNKPLVERFSRFGKFFGCSGHPECKYIKKGTGDKVNREPPKETEHKCPECGKNMIQRWGRRGSFLGCSGYPDCKVTMNLDAEGKPELTSKPTDHVCDKCSLPMVLRKGPRGQFLACTGYPKCRNAKDVDAEGNPVQPIATDIDCAKCGAKMVVKSGPRGPFLGCGAYPKCKSTKRMTDELKEQFKGQLPEPKKVAPAIEVNVACPECGGTMKLRESRRGPFLGCSKYPKCKGTAEVPPELLEQIASRSAI